MGSDLLTFFKKRYASVEAYFASDQGKMLGKIIRHAFSLGILLWLLWQLWTIGFEVILASLPIHPLFYVLITINWLLLPLSEIIAYRRFWPIPVLASIQPLIRKKVFNADFLAYSGEVFFFNWLRKHLALSKKEVFGAVRDNNVLSSIAANFIGVLFIGFLLYGQILPESLSNSNLNHLFMISAGVLLAIVCGITLIFLPLLKRLGWRSNLWLFSVHTGRHVLFQGINILRWAIILPIVPIPIWFTYAAISTVVNRVPFLPNRDLIFVGVNIQVAELMDIAPTEIAAIMVADALANKLLNLVFFLAFNKWRPQS